MIETIFFAIWFFLPAGIANVTPIFASKWHILPQYNYPLDRGAIFRGKRIFGDHKTTRGLLTGIVAGILTIYLQVFLYENIYFIRTILPINYVFINPLVLGFLLSFGALFGDSVKSFFKRRLDIESGKSWFPFDQLDYIIGGIAFSLIYIRLSIIEYVTIIILWFAIHLISTYIGARMQLKESVL